MPPLRLSVVTPCYNEEQSLSELYRRVKQACEACVKDSYEIVLVNDGSTDKTWAGVRVLASHDPHVVGVDLSRNHGHQLALSAGLQICRGERVLILDADLQDPPELLDKMMQLMDGGAEVVYGQRLKREGETVFKKLSARIFYRLLNQLIDIKIPLDTGDFRLISRRALDVLLSMPEHHRFIRGMVSWIGFRQVPLPYERAARFAGETKYPLRKMLQFAFDAITGFSVRPLRWATYIGVFVAFVACLLAVYVFYNWAIGIALEGWSSLMSVVLLLGGSQLIMFGVFGEYLGRLYLESKHRPLFIIQDIVRQQEEPPPAERQRPGSDKAHKDHV